MTGLISVRPGTGRGSAVAMHRISVSLEIASVGLAILGLLYRATLYWQIPVASGEPYGLGDVLDLGFMVLLFVVAAGCAATGVWLSASGDAAARRLAFRPVLIGILSFVIYYFVHPAVPRLL